MNRRISCLAVALAVAFSFVCLPVSARQGKAAGNADGTMRLVAIDLASGTITVADAAGQNVATYALTAVTAVTINSQPAKLSDLRPNMHVLLLVSHGGRTADRIDATSSSPPSSRRAATTKPTPAPPTPPVDLISSNAFWDVLNDYQRRVVQTTGQQFRKLLD